MGYLGPTRKIFKRPLNGAPFSINNPVLDYFNTELRHEQLFFEDGQSPSNLGFFDDGRVKEDPYYPGNKDEYVFYGPKYDDDLLREVVKRINPGDYCVIGNNCQNWSDRVRKEYEHLKKQRDQPPCLSIGGRKPHAC